tara:strand:- start:431 stop:643 length:213 start_codon:yes stop_codon:yes gene_type:complete
MPSPVDERRKCDKGAVSLCPTKERMKRVIAPMFQIIRAAGLAGISESRLAMAVIRGTMKRSIPQRMRTIR